jgi:hypothetical protein
VLSGLVLVSDLCWEVYWPIEDSGAGVSGCEFALELLRLCLRMTRNLPLGAVVTGLVAIFLKLHEGGRVGRVKCSNSRHGVGRFLFKLDLGGSVLLVASMCCLFMAMQWGGHRLPWSSPIIIGLFAVSGFLLLLFLFLE